MENFTIKKKIYYHDTDCGDVVYYSNYLKYFEEVRTEYFLSKGIDIKKLTEKGIFFVVSNVDIKYKKPARYGDMLSVLSKIDRIKSVSIDFIHQIKKDSDLLVECKTTLVLVNKVFKPTSIPQDILTLLSPA